MAKKLKIILLTDILLNNSLKPQVIRSMTTYYFVNSLHGNYTLNFPKHSKPCQRFISSLQWFVTGLLITSLIRFTGAKTIYISNHWNPVRGSNVLQFSLKKLKKEAFFVHHRPVLCKICIHSYNLTSGTLSRLIKWSVDPSWVYSSMCFSLA